MLSTFLFFSIFLRQFRFETQADLGHVVTRTSLDFRAFLLPHPPEYCRWLSSDPAGFIYFLPRGIFDLVWLMLWFSPFVGKVSMPWRSRDCTTCFIFSKFNAERNGKSSLTGCIGRSLSHRACWSVAFPKSVRAHSCLLTLTSSYFNLFSSLFGHLFISTWGFFVCLFVFNQGGASGW